jgi:hypothetical protein
MLLLAPGFQDLPESVVSRDLPTHGGIAKLLVTLEPAAATVISTAMQQQLPFKRHACH